MSATTTTKTGDWGSWLSRTRKNAGLTQTELAELVGVDQSNVSDWERPPAHKRHHLPKPEHLDPIADALGITRELIWAHYRDAVRRRHPINTGLLYGVGGTCIDAGLTERMVNAA